MAARSSLAIGAVGLGAAAVLFVVGRGTPASPAGVDGVAAGLEGKLRETTAGLHARANTLAQAPRLPIAVATDAATVHNLTQDELAFRPQPGEVIEIAQVRRDGSVVSLLRLPDGAASIADLAHAGVSLGRGERGVMLTEVVDVKPESGKEIDHGVLAVSWPLDTRDAEAKLEGLGVPARLEAGGKTVLATSRPIPFEAQVIRVPLGVVDGALVAEAQAPGLTPLREASGGVALVTVVLAAVAWRRRPGSDRLPAGPDRPLAKGSDPEKQPSAVLSSGLSSGEIRVSTTPGPAPAPPGRTSERDVALARTSVVQAAPESVIVKPTTFGRYSVQRKLGSGGMAEVYLANATGEAGFTKPVALKIMHSHLAANPQIVDHFLDEARIASRLSHPNIVQIMDLGKEADAYFIAMEFVDGVDLGQLISDTRMKGMSIPISIALAMLRKVCRGLHAAHTALDKDGKPMMVVHRDVKAENVIVSRQGEVKVSDFGIAKAAGRQAKTSAGQVKGTTAYMAPEHRMGQDVDPRADVYGVGALAYELLAGVEINLDFEVLAMKGVDGWPHLTLPSRIRKDLPPELDDVIWKALAFDKNDRFASCEELEEALEQIATRHGMLIGDKQLEGYMERELS